MIVRPDPEALLAGPLGQWLDEQAKARRKAQELAVSRWTRAALVGLPLLAFLWVLLPFFFQFNLVLTALAIGGGYAWGNAPRRKAMKTVKIGINQAIAEALELSYRHDPEPGPAFELACRFELLPGSDRSSFEDLWTGSLGARAFSLHEAHLERRRRTRENDHYETVFRGAIVQIEFGREFHGTTVVERAKRHRGLLGARRESISPDGRRLDHVDLVHPEFEDEFCVYADDPVEARYLVHPGYVERLMGVQRAFAGQAIRALFSGGDLVVVVETENMFESGSMDASDDRARLGRTIDQFVAIAELAETLNEPERGYSAA